MTHSIWMDGVELTRRFPSLTGNIDVPVAVIGGGITGVVTAYYLAKAGIRVALLEKSFIASGDTGYTTAFLTYFVDGDLKKFKRQFGSEGAKTIWGSTKAAIDEIERIARVEEIDCDFVRVPGYAHAAESDHVGWLKKQAEIGSELGFPVEYHDSGKHSFEQLGVLQLPSQALFHPRKFVVGLAERIVALGGQVFEESMVEAFEGPEKNVLVCAKGKVTAHEVVIATHVPVDNRFEIPTRVKAYMTYAIAAKIPTGILDQAMYFDTCDPYHYFRVNNEDGYDCIILGGEDRTPGKETDPHDRFHALEEYLASILNGTLYEITHRWGGEIFESSDMAPIIGRSLFNEHHLIASGFAGNGMTYGVIAANILSQEIQGEKHPWAKTYTPKRLKGWAKLMSLGAEYAGELVKTRLGTMSIEEDIDEIELMNGEGVVVRKNGEAIAVSRSMETGEICAVSAKCTHLGCLVNWNKTEQSWDCPCHGSRFAPEGDVITGPAIEPLRKFNLSPE